MTTSRANLLLVPSILAVAYLTTFFSKSPFVPIAIFLAGGALTAGFIQAMQGLWSKSRESGRSSIAIVVAIVFRLLIGLFAISCMIYGAMWATGTLSAV